MTKPIGNFRPLRQATQGVALDVERTAQMLWRQSNLRALQSDCQLYRQQVHGWRTACKPGRGKQGRRRIRLHKERGLALQIRQPSVDGNENNEKFSIRLPGWTPFLCLKKEEVLLRPI